MNQILFLKDKEISTNTNNRQNRKNSIKSLFFKFELFIFSFATISFSIYYGYSLYNNYQKENISKKLINNFNISRLYANEDYNASILPTTNLYETDYSKFEVIGLIEITSIKINYPIISKFNNDLLKIAPCRFYGPMPNEIGNMCIAGHNYNSYKFFSKLKDLKIGDKINIYDLSGNKVTYSVYKSYEVSYDDLSCTNQDTNGKKEITLITCNNIKNQRKVIKASAV